MIFKFLRQTNKVHFAQNHFKNTLKTSTFLSIRIFGSHSKSVTMDKVIAIGQMRSTNDKAANRQQVKRNKQTTFSIHLNKDKLEIFILGSTNCRISR